MWDGYIMKQSGIGQNIIKYTIILLTIALSFNACSSQTQYNEYISLKPTQHLHNNLNSAISDISEQLLKTTKKEKLLDGVVATAFVSLTDFKQTTVLGRLLGESMISELHAKGFKVLDFRGRDALIVNKSGEFYITRDTTKLKDEIENANILVGTYSQFDQNSILINVRIMEFETGILLSSARVIYTIQDCNLLNNCTKSNQIQILEDK